MGTYFEAINDNKKVHIDDTIARLHLTRTSLLTNCGYVATNYYKPTGGYSVEVNVKACASIEIPLSNNEKLMSIRIINNDNTSGDKSAGLMGISVSRWENNTYKIWLSLAKYSDWSFEDDILKNITDNIKCYFWGDGINSSDTYGMQIFNANGEQIFHSSDYVMDILSNYSQSIGNVSSSYDLPYINTEISNTKSLLINSLYFYGVRFRSGNEYGWGFGGLYTEGGIYKIHPFYVGPMLDLQTLWNWGTGYTTTNNNFCVIDVPD